MNWFKTHRSSAIVVGTTLALPLLLLLYGVGSLWSLRLDYQRQIDRLEPRLARMLGVMEFEEALRAAYDQVDLRVLNLVYPAEKDRAALGAELQKNARDLMRESGMEITNSQLLPVYEKEGIEYIGLKMTTSGTLAALDAALTALAGYEPLLMVESLDVWPPRQVRGRENNSERSLTATMQLLALRKVQ